MFVDIDTEQNEPSAIIRRSARSAGTAERLNTLVIALEPKIYSKVTSKKKLCI